DYDIPAQPILCTIQRDGNPIKAVVILTKMGLVFVLDRTTGKPIFPIVETPVPASNLEGETLAKTQPIPSLPPPLVPQKLTVEDAWGLDEDQKAKAIERITKLKGGSLYFPPLDGDWIEYPSTI